jgi:hypothetical protein
MEKSNKRGKIPQSDWPLILARYEAGETLSSIARTYDCSPPAISYIVGRSREKPPNETPPPIIAEPQLIKAYANGTSADDASASEPSVVPVTPERTVERRAELPREAIFAAKPQLTNGNGGLLSRNGTGERAIQPTPQSPAALADGEPRRKLHLGFGNGNGDGHSNGAAESPPQQQMPRREAGQQFAQRPSQAAPHGSSPFDNGRNGHALGGRPEAQMPRDDAPIRKDTGTSIDQELRSRVDGDITAFLTAFDAVLAADTQESRFGLREATDRLLRAGARTRIELERLEARVPLTPRDGGGRSEPALRYR